MKTYVESRGIDPRFLDFLTSCRWVVSLTPRPLYPRGNSPRSPLARRLGGPPGPVWTTWRSKNSWKYRDSNSDPSVVQPVANRYTDCPIPAQSFGNNIIKHHSSLQEVFHLVTLAPLLWVYYTFHKDSEEKSPSSFQHPELRVACQHYPMPDT
jgi:hypothetical protein